MNTLIEEGMDEVGHQDYREGAVQTLPARRPSSAGKQPGSEATKKKKGLMVNAMRLVATMKASPIAVTRIEGFLKCGATSPAFCGATVRALCAKKVDFNFLQ